MKSKRDVDSPLKKLLNNTLLFAIGNFGSKILVLLLVPIYTASLTTAEYGTIDLILNVVNILTPVFAFSVYEAVFRDQLDDQISRREKDASFYAAVGVISAVFIVSLGVVLAISLVLSQANALVLIFSLILIFMQNIQNLFGQYVRANNMTVRYTVNGVLTAFALFIASIVLVYMLKLGVVGYLSATIASVFISWLILLPGLPKLRNWHIRTAVTKQRLRSMAQYAVPMIPNAILWWLFNGMVRFAILFTVGVSENGLFAAASKIPSVISVVVYIFMQAWELNAVTVAETGDRNSYRKILNGFIVVQFFIAFTLMVFAQLVGRVFIGTGEFASGWTLMPGLLLDNFWYGLATILGVNYMVSRRTKGLGISTGIAFVVTAVGLAILLPPFGVNGALVALNLGYFTMAAYRLIDTKTMKDVSWIGFTMVVLILTATSWLVARQPEFNLAVNGRGYLLGLVLVAVCYVKSFFQQKRS